MSTIRTAANRLCIDFPGGYDGMAIAIGASSGGMLRQKVLGHKGARLDIEEVVAIQSAAGSTALVEAMAVEFGGMFVQLPSVESVHNQEIHTALANLVVRFGKLNADFSQSIADNEVDYGERQLLEADAKEISRHALEFVALVVAVFGNADAQQDGPVQVTFKQPARVSK